MECRCVFAIGEERQEKTLLLPTVEPERQELIEKRFIKRMCKVTLYELLKRLTGQQPPWGSLTGIRPTRLIYEGLADGLTMDEACARVEQTFDVQPEKVALLREIVEVQRTLPEPGPEEADLYVSIPFCRTRCAYCSFPGEAVGKGKLIPPYLDALLWELEEAERLFRQAKLGLRAVYVGGGTPTALAEPDFARLMNPGDGAVPQRPGVHRGGGTARHHHPGKAGDPEAAGGAAHQHQSPDHERRDPAPHRPGSYVRPDGKHLPAGPGTGLRGHQHGCDYGPSRRGNAPV